MSGALNMMLGALASVVVTLTDVTVSENDGGQGNVDVGYRTNSDGTVDTGFNQGAGSIAWSQFAGATDWIIPNAAASGDYEVRATLDSGDTPTTGTLNTWEALSSTRTWTLSRSTTGTSTSNLTIEIRNAAGTVLDSASVTLEATVA